MRPMVDLVPAGMLLVIVGFGVVIFAMLSHGGKEGTEVKGGGVVLIGPIPIIFGSDMKWASIAIVLAIILIVVTLVFTLV